MSLMKKIFLLLLIISFPSIAQSTPPVLEGLSLYHYSGSSSAPILSKEAVLTFSREDLKSGSYTFEPGDDFADKILVLHTKSKGKFKVVSQEVAIIVIGLTDNAWPLSDWKSYASPWEEATPLSSKQFWLDRQNKTEQQLAALFPAFTSQELKAALSQARSHAKLSPEMKSALSRCSLKLIQENKAGCSIMPSATRIKIYLEKDNQEILIQEFTFFHPLGC